MFLFPAYVPDKTLYVRKRTTLHILHRQGAGAGAER